MHYAVDSLDARWTDDRQKQGESTVWPYVRKSEDIRHL